LWGEVIMIIYFLFASFFQSQVLEFQKKINHELELNFMEFSKVSETHFPQILINLFQIIAKKRQQYPINPHHIKNLHELITEGKNIPKHDILNNLYASFANQDYKIFNLHSLIDIHYLLTQIFDEWIWEISTANHQKFTFYHTSSALIEFLTLLFHAPSQNNYEMVLKIIFLGFIDSYFSIVFDPEQLIIPHNFSNKEVNLIEDSNREELFFWSEKKYTLMIKNASALIQTLDDISTKEKNYFDSLRLSLKKKLSIFKLQKELMYNTSSCMNVFIRRINVTPRLKRE